MIFIVSLLNFSPWVCVLKMDPDLDLKCQQPIINIANYSINFENNHHENINSQIISLYIREILDEIQVLEKLRVKIQRRVENLEFLKACKDKNILPKFACINHKIKNKSEQCNAS
jgi:hypothetical protein